MKKVIFLKYVKEAAQVFLSIIAIAAIAYFVDIGKVAQAIAGANPAYIIAAILCYAGINVAMSYRISMLLGDMKAGMGFRKVISSHFAGMLASDFTPARSGYFATALALARHGATVSQGVAAILAPQIFDFLLKVIAGGAMLAYVAGREISGQSSLVASMLGIAAVALMLLFAVMLVFSRKFLLVFKPLFGIVPFGGKAFAMLESMQGHSMHVKTRWLEILGLLALTWTLKGMEWMFLAKAIGMGVDFPYGELAFFMFLQPLVTILQFVPFPTAAGSGLSEAGAIGILFLFGISAPVAAAFAILTRGMTTIVDLIGLREVTKLDFDALANARLH